jgi:RHS repeat-associated protein
VQFLHADQLGSTRLLTDLSGAVVGSFAYTPYGQLAGKTGTADTALRFTGQYTDPTGYLYLRARVYDPATGVFLSRDPLNILTREAYGYVAGNPLQGTDPTGLWGWDDTIGFVGALNEVSSAVSVVSGAVLAGSLAITAVAPNPITAGIAAVAAPVFATSTAVSMATGAVLATSDYVHGCDPTDELLSMVTGRVFSSAAPVVNRTVWTATVGTGLKRAQRRNLSRGYDMGTRTTGEAAGAEYDGAFSDYNPYGG